MGNQIVKEVIIYLAIVSFFITGNGFLVSDITIYWYYPVYALLLLVGVALYHKIDVRLVVFTIVLWLLALATAFYNVSDVLKQLVNITFSLISLYYVFVITDFDLHYLIKRYIVVSKIVVILGFIQVTLFTLHQGHWFLKIFQFLRESNISYRFQSVCQEPSYAGYVLAPLAFMSLHTMVFGRSKFLTRSWSFLIIVAYLFTFSLVAYVGIVLMAITLYFKNFSYRHLYIFAVVVAGIVFFAVLSYRNISLLRLRVDDTYYAFKTGITNYDVYTRVNLSTYAILTNLHVTTSSIKDHPITGTGLGTYALAYDHYMPERMKSFSTINRGEGSSMGYRLLTETGIFGFGLFLFFLYRFRIKGQPFEDQSMDVLWMMNAGIFVMSILLLIRHGHYTTQGRLFFFLFYYYAYKAYAIVAQEKSQPYANHSIG